MKKPLFLALGIGSILLTSPVCGESYSIQGVCSGRCQETVKIKECATNDVPQHHSQGRLITVTNLNTKQLKSLLSSKMRFALIDARSPKFDDGRRIPGARTLPPNATAQQIVTLLPNKDAYIVIYCSNVRCPASQRLAEKLTSLGYTNVHEYPDGIDGWIAAGNSVDVIPKDK